MADTKDKVNSGRQERNGRHNAWRRAHDYNTRQAQGLTDTWRPRFGGKAKANIRRTHGGFGGAGGEAQGGQVLGARTQAVGRGQKTWPTRLGGTAKANTRRTHAGQGLAPPQRTQGGQKGDTCRTMFGGAVKFQSGHKADMRRTNPIYRNAARAYTGQPFIFPKREPHRKLYQHRPLTVFQAQGALAEAELWGPK